MSVSVRGISSGIDINGIIDELMAVERQPIRRKEAQIERTEQIAELWREVNSRLDTLKRTLSPLQNSLTFTAPVPVSSNEEVMRAKISGQPTEGSYSFNVDSIATKHTVAASPPTAGDRISSTNEALDLFGTFYLGTGRPPEGLDELTFDSTETDWLRGNFGAGLQAVVSGVGTDVYTLKPDIVNFDIPVGDVNTDYSIDVYFDSFTDSAGEDLQAELEAYFTDKGWTGIDLENDPLFTIKYDGTEWVAHNQNGDDFAFLGDHPLGTFDLRGDIIDGSNEVVAVNNFDFHILDEVDDTGFITVEEDDSLLVIAQRINNKTAETGVSASVVKANEGDYRLILESSIEGKEGFIQAYDYDPLNAAGDTTYGTDNILQALNLLGSNDNSALPDYLLEPQEARNAEFTLNGLEMTRSSNTFTDVIDGLEITLRSSGFAILDVAPDTDSAVQEISLFVEAVNEVNSYLRLLQENEEGPLQGSSDLMRIERQLRTLIGGPVTDISGSSHLNEEMTYTGTNNVSATATGVYTGTSTTLELIYHSSGMWRHDGVNFESGDTVKGVTIDISGDTPAVGDKLILNVSPPSEPLVYDSLSSIGILATDKEGILQIDNAKLQQALADDPEGIFKMFAREAPLDPRGWARGPDGIAVQMETFVNNLIGGNGLVQNRQGYLERQITQYQDRIEMLERRMEMREQRLVRQFTFMEQYIARIQEQTGLMASFELMMQGQGNQ